MLPRDFTQILVSGFVFGFLEDVAHLFLLDPASPPNFFGSLQGTINFLLRQ
jgi:hypothetical protein